MLTRSWTERPFAVLDTETTDVNPYTAHIVQLALVLVAPDGSILEAHNAIINPGVPIPQTASAVHGIDDAAVKEHGAHPLPVLKNLSMMLSGLAHMGWPLVIYTAVFDWPLILSHFHRHGVAMPRRTPHIIDPLVIDRKLNPFRPGLRRLSHVAAAFGYQLTNAHDALEDCLATAAVLRGLIRQHPRLGRYSLDQLDRLQALWHRRWAEELMEFRRKIGRPVSISPRWPYDPDKFEAHHGVRLEA